MRTGLALLLPPAVLLALFFAYPLAHTLAAAFSGADAWAWATRPFVQGRVRVALLQAVLSVVLTLALALPLAWLHHARRIPFTRFHLAVHAAPFVLPVFVVVFGIQAVLGPGGWIAEITGVDALRAIGPLGAVVVAHAYYNYGFAARLLHASLERRPRRLEEAAAVLGASRAAASWRVTLPLLAPSVAAVALLVFVFAFTSFGVVLYMGGGRVSTLDTLIYENIGGGFPRYDRAAVLGVIQLALNAILLNAYLRLRRREAAVPRGSARVAPAARTKHHALAWGALALGVLPAASVLVKAFRYRGEWSLEPFRALVDATHPAHLTGFDLSVAVSRSLLYAGASTVASLALTIALAYGIRGTRGVGRRLVEVAAAVPIATSSLLLGFGYVLAFGAGGLLDLRGSLVVIVIAHTLVAFPFTSRALVPALDELEHRLDDAAAVLGAPPMAVARRVHWPLLRPAVLVAAGFAAALSLGDFGASLLLMRPENMSVAVWIDRHGGVGVFDPLLRAQSVALAAILMVMAALAYFVVERFRVPGEADL